MEGEVAASYRAFYWPYSEGKDRKFTWDERKILKQY